MKVCPACRREFPTGDECPTDHVRLLPVRKKDAYVGQVLGGRYAVENCVGEGGMGLVYRARDHKAENMAVAIKLLPIENDDESRDHAARFAVEARVMQRLKHPSIVRILDQGSTPEVAFLVMEFLRGMPLAAAVPSDGLEWPLAVSILRDLCSALEVAHGANVIHRDLKADNVFLARQPNGTARVKLIDFGLAKDLGGGGPMTGHGSVVGSAGYIAPEHIMGGRDFTPQSDIYALGAILFLLLTGRAPYHGMPLAKIMKAQVSQPPPALGLPKGHASLALEPVVHRAMDRDPRNRHASVRDFAEAMVSATAALKHPGKVDTVLAGMELVFHAA